jgi:hypothetical protein
MLSEKICSKAHDKKDVRLYPFRALMASVGCRDVLQE